MATDITPKTSPTESGTGLVYYRLSVSQYLKILQAGVFPDGARVELIRGRLVKRMTKKTPHNFAVDTLAEFLRQRVGREHLVREEKSVQLGPWSRPEPDIAVLRGPRDRFRTRDPQAEDLVLVIEVADSTYRKERGSMWRLYAAAGVPVYWVVNIRKKLVEVYSEPSGNGPAAEYRRVAALGPDAAIPIVIEGREVGTIPVIDILP